VSGLSLRIDVSGLPILVRGIAPGLRPSLEDAWAGFLVPQTSDPILEVQVEDGSKTLTPGRVMVGGIAVKREGDVVRFVRDEAEGSLDLVAGRATVALSAGEDTRRAWGLVNLVHAALAWRLASRGGGIVHAAGVLVEGRAFLLIGSEGAGKSTFARVAATAGLPVVGDDQVVVLRSGGGLEAVGAPVRNREHVSAGRGRWPIAAFLLPRHGAPAAVAPASRLDLLPRLAANLVYNLFEEEGLLDRIAEGVPARWLTFAPDPSFVPLLRAL